MKNNNQRQEQDPIQIISVEGLNGAGKTVFTSKLKEQLEVLGFQVLVIKAPLYEIQDDQINHYGPEIHAHLNQRPQTVRGDTIEKQPSTLASLPSIDEMFRINRLYIQEHIIDKQIGQYDFLIIDRWIMSGAVYSCFRQHQTLQAGTDLDYVAKAVLQGRPKVTHRFPDREVSPFKGVDDIESSSLFIDTFSDTSTRGEILPDLTVFIDTGLDLTLQRIQARKGLTINESSSNQIYSTLPTLQGIRSLFKCYIEQQRHRQNILIIEDNNQIEPVLALVTGTLSRAQQKQDKARYTDFNTNRPDNAYIRDKDGYDPSNKEDPTMHHILDITGE